MYLHLLHSKYEITVTCSNASSPALYLKRSDLTCELEDFFRQNDMVNSLEGRGPIVSRTFNDNSGPQNSS